MAIVRRLSFWLATGTTLLIAHDAIFFAQEGPARALSGLLRNAGHGYWPAASMILTLGGILAAGFWLVRMLALHRRAGRAQPTRPRMAAAWRARALSRWPGIFLLVVVLFALQENVEHLVGHGHPIGLGALLGPEYPLALPVIALVSACAAFLFALVRWHEAELLRTIAAAANGRRRAPRHLSRHPSLRRPPAHGALMAINRALRAPPGATSTT